MGLLHAGVPLSHSGLHCTNLPTALCGAAPHNSGAKFGGACKLFSVFQRDLKKIYCKTEFFKERKYFFEKTVCARPIGADLMWL